MPTEKMETYLHLDLPIKTVSEANRRDHWRTKYKRRTAQMREVNAEWKRALKGRPVPLPCKVVLTRIGAKVLDTDNLQSSMKAIRDEVAWLIGRDDSPNSPISWEYKQEAKGRREYRVKIEVQSL